MHDFQHALATVGANCTEEAQMFFSAPDGGTVPRQILVASRRSSLFTMPTSTSASQSSHTCSSPDAGGADMEEDKEWNVATTPTLEAHLSSFCSTCKGCPNAISPSKPRLATSGSNIDVSDLLADLPEVLRAGVPNGSLVPAYESTGWFLLCFCCSTFVVVSFCRLFIFVFSLF